MKKLLFLFLITYNNSEAQLQLPKDSVDKNAASPVIAKANPDERFFKCMFYEPMPEFPGGELAMKKFLSENIQYPDTALKYEKQGIVRVQYTIEEDGSISNVIVKRPLGFGLDEEAVRVIKLMPKWTPGRNLDGQVTKTRYQIPVKFLLK